MRPEDCIKSEYRFKEVNTMMKELTLDEKEQIAVEVIARALKLCKHKAAIAFSGGKDRRNGMLTKADIDRLLTEDGWEDL